MKNLKIYLTKHIFMYYSINRRKTIKVKLLFPLILLFFNSLSNSSFAFSLIEEALIYRQKGYEAQMAGDLEVALSYYQKAVYANPQHATCYNDLGIIYEIRGERDRAEQCYLKAIELDKNYLATYSNLAYLYEKKQDYPKAIYYLRERIALGKPEDLWTERAKESLKRLSSKSEDARKLVMGFEVSSLAKEVVEKKRQELEECVSKAKMHFTKGKEFYQKKLYTKAIDEFNLALRFTPGEPKIVDALNTTRNNLINEKIKEHSKAGLKFYEVGDVNSAKDEFNQILAIIQQPPTSPAKAGSRLMLDYRRENLNK